MTKERAMLFVICVLMSLIILSSISGCGPMRAVFGLQTIPNGSLPPVPTSKGQLWETIKGMTPNWLAIPVIALGAVAMFNGAAKLGFSCIIFGSVNLFMALATSRFGLWMAVFGLIGSCAAVAISILVKNKAIREMIFGIQQVKEEVIQDLHKPRTKQILSKQTKSTQKLVAKVKTKEKLKLCNRLHKDAGWK